MAQAETEALYTSSMPYLAGPPMSRGRADSAFPGGRGHHDPAPHPGDFRRDPFISTEDMSGVEPPCPPGT